jgi:hypothetical protein
MKKGRKRKELQIDCKKNQFKTEKNQKNGLSIENNPHNTDNKKTKGKVQCKNRMKHRRKKWKKKEIRPMERVQCTQPNPYTHKGPRHLGREGPAKEGENTRSILLAKDVVEYSYNPKRFL